MHSKQISAGILAVLMTASLFLSGCASSSSESTAKDSTSTATTEESTGSSSEATTESIEVSTQSEAKDENGNDLIKSCSIVVRGYEWGPGVPKIVLGLSRQLSDVSDASFSVSTAQEEREISGIYLSDEKGNAVDGASEYLTIEMETEYDAETMHSPGSPFTYNMETFQNNWSESYPVNVTGSFTADDENVTIEFTDDCINSRICEDTELFNKRDTFSGTYHNDFTGEDEEQTLQYAAYEPESLSGGEKNPLIIWLHGQGEGGTDIDIALLGNEVTALAKDEIQSYFTAGDETGAYVLAVQTSTYWMDEGDGTNGNGSGTSRYTQILMDTIENYVESNPDVDTDRIYIGGCSNGGYMTMNMIINYPDYFAAAYPVCEAYSYYEWARNDDGTYKVTTNEQTGMPEHEATDTVWMTEEKIEAIKNLPIWFVQSADDTTVDPTMFGEPTYQALVKAGASNCWYSMFETVNGTDDPDATYMGHWSWIYLFNNQVSGVQDPEAIAASEDASEGFTANNESCGGTMTASDENGTYTNIFAWLNVQKKQ